MNANQMNESEQLAEVLSWGDDYALTLYFFEGTNLYHFARKPYLPKNIKSQEVAQLIEVARNQLKPSKRSKLQIQVVRTGSLMWDDQLVVTSEDYTRVISPFFAQYPDVVEMK